MIRLKPIGGLCNRLRAIESAIRLSSAINSKVLVYWVLDRGGECVLPSKELFTINKANISVREIARQDFFTHLRFAMRNPWCFKDENANEYVKKLLMGTFIPYGGLVTCREFYAAEVRDYSWLIPNASILERVEREMSLWDSPVGVHIRRTDNTWAIENSPLELFINRLDKEVEFDSDCQFFVASDDEETKAQLRARYGKRMHTRLGLGLRESCNGLIDGFIDLLLLSKTRKIFGSYGSSFSVVASQIGNVPLEVVSYKQGGENDQRTNWQYAQKELVG